MSKIKNTKEVEVTTPEVPTEVAGEYRQNNLPVYLDDLDLNLPASRSLARNIGTRLTYDNVEILPLNEKKGNAVLGEYLGESLLTTKHKSYRLFMFAVLKTNMDGRRGAIGRGEEVGIFYSGQLDWALKKSRSGRVLMVEYAGKQKTVLKRDGKELVCHVNNYNVTDMTDIIRQS